MIYYADDVREECSLSNKEQGFTLLELSIVLVIIGLIAGGITVGADMIRAAEIRAVITEHQRFQTAAMVFRDKYFALPGDMTNATAFWGVSTTDGNGDGVIGNIVSVGVVHAENTGAWQQLSLAGLIEGAYVAPSPLASPHVPGENIPASKRAPAGYNFIHVGDVLGTETSGGISAFFGGHYKTILLFGASGGVNHLGISAALTPEEAWNIDVKLDDGKPAYGAVRTNRPVGWLSVPQDCATTTVAATAEYQVTLSSIECPLVFMGGF